MMDIEFFDDSSAMPRAREDVRFNQLALYLHPSGSRRVAVGFDITPFRERPSVEVEVRNTRGEWAGSLTVIETLDANFHLTLHLRDREPTTIYHLKATLYYGSSQEGKMVVDTKFAEIDLTQPGSEIRVT